jgi:heterodisulfide reductase subunit A
VKILKSKAKVGVYICHCGINIAGVIDVNKLTKYATSIPNVVVAKNYKFMCSENGQSLIQKDIQDGLVNRVVVAACSPRMHESTFRLTCKEAGLNQFLFEQANIREHATWVNIHDSEGALDIAKDHIRMAVAKVSELKPLDITKVPVKPSCLVVGGGIAGMNSALDIAKDGYDVYLVEKLPSIGGHMAQLDKTFPTMDCSACILTPKTAEVARNEKIHLYTYSEIESVDGYVGNFEVTIKEYPHYIDQEKCTGCGSCAEECLVDCGNEFDLGMKSRKAAYIPFPQAVPGKYTIDMNHCIKCGVCAEVCPVDAINFDDKVKLTKVKVGTIILATGYDPFDPTVITQYGFGKYENVITGFQMERLLSSVGPTGGKVKRPSDKKEPKSIIFVQCVGSRDFHDYGHKYCSRVCCMYATKQARQYKEKHPETSVYIFYIDVRAFGKGYEEFYNRAGEEYGIRYIRGKVAEIYEDEDHNVIVRGEDTLLMRELEIKADLAVLSMALEPRSDIDKLARIFNIQRSEDGFIMEAHPKLKPVETLTEGIFIAGSVQGPKDIPDTVAQAKAAASSAAGLMATGEIEIEPYFSTVLDYKCAGCKSCLSICAFNAITFNNFKKVAEINEILCKGCGTCVSACPSLAIVQNHFGTTQLNAMISTAISNQSVIKNGGS